ncbi:MAG TPA: DsrE/DsrF/DrsH-like family protein [Jiangellaceae bacterium]
MTTEISAPEAQALTEEDVRRIVREEVTQAFAKNPASRRAAIIASKGTLDWAYPPLILANAAAAAGMDVSVFFTFYGLNIIHRDFERKLKVDPVGNPAMPMPVPMPDVVTGMPGMLTVASKMMRSKFAKNNVANIRTLLDSAMELDVRLIACQMTVDVFDYKEDEFLDGVEFGGAAAFMSEARRSQVTLFI